ncbi:dihydrolipoyl dehydrogenase family protein [Lactobacillus selangorensis]|nr:NAD(P)/FAD-dependent oxidoreductase [Lactobacillus selangorensis]
MAYEYDVAFIGSGQGAWNGAIPMAQAGLKVAVIERGLWGGVCTNRGCNAKFTLDRPVALLTQIKQLQGRGFDSVPQINWPDLMAHKHEVIGPLSDSNRQKLINAGVKTIVGCATFVDAHTLQVNHHTLTADKIVIVSGQRPKRLDIPGQQYMHDSTDFLSATPLPHRLVILGAGFVGMEAASIAKAAGADVTLIVDSTKALKQFYQPAVKQLISQMQSDGIKFIFGQETTAVEKTATGYRLLGANQFVQDADYILDATGRTPNIEKLNLPVTKVTTDAHGIIVNDHLQTAEPNIYATGDVVSKRIPKITPTAIFESQYLAQLFTQQTTAAIQYPAIGVNVFTMPRLAQVGISPDVAKQELNKYRVEHYCYADDWYHQVQNETSGGLTVVFNRQDQLVGAVDLSNEAPNTINTFIDYIQMGITAKQLHNFVYIFPSLQHSTMRKM